MAGFHGYAAVQARGNVTLPPELRRRYHLDEPGAQVEIVERDDGVLEFRPTVPVPADQAWFWTERWQEGEREVDEHVAAGRVTVHEDAVALVDHLEKTGRRVGRVKFETTPAFDADYKRLKKEWRRTFLQVVKDDFAPACADYVSDPARQWPARLRVKPVRRASGILEMTWSFSGPDGRATFEFLTVDGELRCRWRRIGDHGIFADP